MSSRSRVRPGGRLALTTFSANADRRRREVALDHLVDEAVAQRPSAPIVSPLDDHWSAFSTPRRRGSRRVPPAPGNNPSFPANTPNRADFTLTWKWQASATSSPVSTMVPRPANYWLRGPF